jgi:hypothetical protein
MPDLTAAEPWLAAVWPVVRARLSAAPATVVEVGCGPLGGWLGSGRPWGAPAEHELAAIEAGEVRATRVDYAGRLRRWLLAGTAQH